MVEESLETTVRLNNGVEMPRLGLGVWKTNNTNAKESVSSAIQQGYRLIDTAKQYGNETGVGEGIREGLEKTGLDRKDLFITTKVFNGDQGYQSTLDKFEGSLKRLQLDYVDLLLIHWPVDGKYLDTWKAMEKLYHDGKVRAIGVSNFDVERLQNLLDHAEVKPVINQMEFNPLQQEKEILNFAQEQGIQLEAWSPLGGGAALNNPTIQKIADAHNKSTAQVIIRWDWQRGIVTIPKSAHPERIAQNSDIFDFSLSDDEVQAINDLDENKASIWYQDFGWYEPNGGVDTGSVDKWDDSPADYDK
ncbi:diketogulonate reductase-like aldo/keto reductase [Weissella uvarum]|uniref:aldo/keto reductase n=1 Tax=Weissella uvarum TaxID=1479233 RepID=UPI001960D2EA|nr:aldo/keto reductase [Weissella uvarum]MBM7616722.1 diketogulonate reductase-like aldo/keto reductase [Weissella uvarum]MCM0594823.1 aldo/keto reductase [Weissella uvarum]